MITLLMIRLLINYGLPSVTVMIMHSVRLKSFVYIFTGEAIGDGSKRPPYSKISSLGIVITGLPDGISLKHPSSYGQKQLQSILDCRERLTLNSKI